MEAIQTIGLTKKYKSLVAVEDLNLQIRQGELFALLGVNGAGKTTTIKMLSCLTPPTSGTATVDGYDIVRETAAVKSVISVSPQNTAIAPNLTVWENLDLIGAIHCFPKETRRQKIREIAERLDLQNLLQRRAGKLSGGLQRRLSIALALICEPSVLFLDEPTLGLDVIARRELWKIINSLKGKITVILTTHYMEEAAALADRIGVMKDGKLLMVGSTQELMAKTATDTFEEAFISIVTGG